jgi:hypothetical protein
MLDKPVRQNKNVCNVLKTSERACKPDSVRHAFPRAAAIIPLGRRSLDGSSGLPEGHNGPGQPSPPIWPCTARGLPCRRHCCLRGGLLPHRFTLTGCDDLLKTCQRFGLRPITDFACTGGLFSVALSVAEPSPAQPPGVTRRAALRSPDFPPGVHLQRPAITQPARRGHYSAR